MFTQRTNWRRWVTRFTAAAAIVTMIVWTSGCGPSALGSGNAVPAIAVAGWTNGEAPTDLSGNVVVLEVFATW